MVRALRQVASPRPDGRPPFLHHLPHGPSPNAVVSDDLKARYPEEITIVLQHQFWELEGRARRTSRWRCRFNQTPQILIVPYAAVTAFVDPSVKFGLQFHPVMTGDDDGVGHEATGHGDRSTRRRPNRSLRQHRCPRRVPQEIGRPVVGRALGGADAARARRRAGDVRRPRPLPRRRHVRLHLLMTSCGSRPTRRPRPRSSPRAASRSSTVARAATWRCPSSRCPRRSGPTRRS